MSFEYNLLGREETPGEEQRKIRMSAEWTEEERESLRELIRAEISNNEKKILEKQQGWQYDKQEQIRALEINSQHLDDLIKALGPGSNAVFFWKVIVRILKISWWRIRGTRRSKVYEERRRYASALSKK